MDSILILVLGMGLVTYIPRMIPMVVLQNLKMPDFLKRFLEFVPFAALGALIFPGVLNSTNSTESAIFGTVISIVLAYFRVNIILVVLGGVLGVYLWGLLI